MGALKSPPPAETGPSADTPFKDLCALPGTLLCDPLDKGEISGPGVTADTPVKTLPEALAAKYGSWRIGLDKYARSSKPRPKSYRAPELDQKIFASGNGSIKFTVELQSGAGDASKYEVALSDNRPMGIQKGEAMRVRFKVRWSCDMLFTDCDPNSAGYQKGAPPFCRYGRKRRFQDFRYRTGGLLQARWQAHPG